MKMKRFFALMLALALSLTMLQGVAFGASSWDAATGTLTISDIASLSPVLIDGAIDDVGSITRADVKALIMASGVYTIQPGAFENLTNLASVTIGSSVTNIAIGAFSGNKVLTSINVDNNNANYYSEDGVLFQKDPKTLHAYPLGKTGDSYTVPADVTAITYYVFNGNTNLKTLILPTGLLKLDFDVMVNSGITSIIFEGSSVTDIHSTVFDRAINLETINLAGAYVDPDTATMARLLAEALAKSSDITPSNITINYNQSWTDEQVKVLEDAFSAQGVVLAGINPYDPNPTDSSSGSVGGSTGGGSGAGAWYIGTLNGANGQPTYTQIVDIADTTAMLETGNVVTVTGQSPTGIIVKLDPTALAGKQSLSINSSITDMQLTAEQIASLIQQADGNTIHITIKGTPDGSTINILAGGRTITL